MSFNLLQIEQSKVLIPITNAKQKQSRTRHTTNVLTYFFRTDHELKINSEKQRAPFLLASPAHREPGYEAIFLSIEPLYLKRSRKKFSDEAQTFADQKSWLHSLKLLSLQLDSERGQMNQLFIPLTTHHPYMPTNRTLTAADSYNMAGPHVDQASS